MNADGSAQTRLTDDPGFDNDPAFSPDGKLIAFRSNRDGRWQLYLMKSDGSGQHNISNSQADDNWFWWSPDNTQIYLSSTLGQDQQNLEWSASIINVDGSGRRPFPFGGNVNWRP
jgi:TolB protein